MRPLIRRRRRMGARRAANFTMVLRPRRKDINYHSCNTVFSRRAAIFTMYLRPRKKDINYRSCYTVFPSYRIIRKRVSLMRKVLLWITKGVLRQNYGYRKKVCQREVMIEKIEKLREYTLEPDLPYMVNDYWQQSDGKLLKKWFGYLYPEMAGNWPEMMAEKLLELANMCIQNTTAHNKNRMSDLSKKWSKLMKTISKEAQNHCNHDPTCSSDNSDEEAEKIELCKGWFTATDIKICDNKAVVQNKDNESKQPDKLEKSNLTQESVVVPCQEPEVDSSCIEEPNSNVEIISIHSSSEDSDSELPQLTSITATRYINEELCQFSLRNLLRNPQVVPQQNIFEVYRKEMRRSMLK